MISLSDVLIKPINDDFLNHSRGCVCRSERGSDDEPPSLEEPQSPLVGRSGTAAGAQEDMQKELFIENFTY